jgi:uncharacterized glyoxalase superfamily protein PhnB
MAFAAGPPVFESVDIDKGVGIGYGVSVADVDGDGKPDVLLADKDAIAWYRNPRWEKSVIARKLTELDHVCLDARDLDGDGKAEIAVGAGWNPGDTVASGSVHYLVAPSDRAAPWTPVALPHEPTMHRMRWIRDAHEKGAFSLLVAPLHGRGNVNAAGAGVKLQLYRKPADPGAPWEIETIDDALHATHNVDPVQWDGDPEDEIVVASREGLFLLDRGATGAGSFTRRALVSGADFPGASEVRSGKLAGDRRFLASIEPFHGNRLMVAIEGDGTAPWRRQLLDEDLKEGHALACGDLLGLGHDQIVAGWRQENAAGRVGIRLYVPRDEKGLRWERFAIDDNSMACEDLKLADLDGDGRLDVIAAGRATRNLRVYFNRTPSPERVNDMTAPRLYRVILQVNDVEKAAAFYGAVLGAPGRRVSPGRHYFDCGGTILACYDPRADGDAADARPNPDHVYLAVGDLEAVFERAKKAGCREIEPAIETRPWGERSFYAKDPFGNPICFVDEKTVFTGR